MRLTRPRRVAGQVLPPPPYIRRHTIEHAAAGHVLDEDFLSAEFLPYVDAARLRPLAVGGPAAAGSRPVNSAVPSLVEVWRKAAHAWSWSPQPQTPMRGPSGLPRRAARRPRRMYGARGGLTGERAVARSWAGTPACGRWPPPPCPTDGWSPSPAAPTPQCGCGPRHRPPGGPSSPRRGPVCALAVRQGHPKVTVIVAGGGVACVDLQAELL